MLDLNYFKGRLQGSITLSYRFGWTC